MVKETNKTKTSKILVGNTGLFYSAYELSKRGFYVFLTSRNTEGYDLVAVKDKNKVFLIEVKTLSKKNAVPFGGKDPKEKLRADFIFVVLGLENPKIYIVPIEEMLKRVVKQKNKEAKDSFWVKFDSIEEFEEKWELLD